MANPAIKVFLLTGLLASTQALALYQEGKSRPVFEIENAEVLHSTHGFVGSTEVSLTMIRRDAQPNFLGFVFEFDNTVQGITERVSHELVVTTVEVLEDGSTVYYAALEQKTSEHRVNLTLIDRSTSKYQKHMSYEWEANVREGYGWCGTGDSVITFAGNPNPVFTITGQDTFQL